MTVRERLIELFMQAEAKCNGMKQCEGCVGFGEGANCVDYLIVDHLLTNGVIVPPCKVGDTVYHVYKGNTIVNALVEDWKKEAFGDCLFRAYFSVNGSSITLLFGDNNIGKTVFLTRDDAEKALEGMQ